MPTPSSIETNELVQLALEGLKRMYDPERNTLFTRIVKPDGENRSYLLSRRYCVMSSIGLARAGQSGFELPLNPADILEAGLSNPHDQGADLLAAGLWSAVEQGLAPLSGRLAHMLLRSLNQPLSLEKSVGRVLAWSLISLSRLLAQESSIDVGITAKTLRDLAIHKLWSRQGKLFRHFDRGFKFSSGHTLFSTQIYWIMALSAYAKATGDQESLDIAASCSHKLASLRDKFGGFAWRYYSYTGKVVEPFPVYSVHQDAMAPMAFFELKEAGGEDVTGYIPESLDWLWKNQLHVCMVDTERKLVFRALKRRPLANAIFMQTGRLVSALGKTGPGAITNLGLEVNETCRPYHLGWILYAWAGREAP